jgi:hypothetical protein
MTSAERRTVTKANAAARAHVALAAVHLALWAERATR